MTLPNKIADADLPSEGIHHDIPFEEYLAWDAINSGSVRWGMVTPRHMRSALDGRVKSDDTKDKKLGRSIHVMLLEGPEKFCERVKVADPCCGIIKNGDRKGQQCGCDSKLYDGENWFCGTHGKGIDDSEVTDYVSKGEFIRIQRIAESIHEHEVTELFRRPGWSEVSLLWKQFGLTFKARIDRYAGGDNPVIIDIKKCQVGAGSRDDCEKAICNYGWYRQAAIYMRGIEFLTGTRPDFVWVFIEDNEPYDVNVIPIDDETFDIGAWEVDRVISSHKRCIDNGRFYGYIFDAKRINRGGLPNWKRKEFHNIL